MAEKTEKTSQSGALARRGSYDPFSLPSFGGGLLSSPFTMMRRMMEDFDRAWSGFGTGQTAGGMMAWSPAVEVRERDGNLIVCAELPGLSKEDVRVEATDDAIVIEGEKKQEYKSDEGGVHRSERSYGRFYRAIPLPEGTHAEQAKAKFNNGVLEVTVPLPQQRSSRRQIQVEEGAAQTRK
jgi:HSP20 family protein